MIHLRVVTDAKWLSFVIDQLLSNALKYTHEGSISIYLENQSLVIEDTGIGISAEDLPRVGQRNFTGFTGRQQKKCYGHWLLPVQTSDSEIRAPAFPIFQS